MNLKSKKAQASIAALGACTLVVGGGWLASNAFGAGQTLSFLGATDNAASIVAADPTALSGITYGVKIGGLSSSDTRVLRIETLSAPNSGTLMAERIADNGNPVNGTYTNVKTGASNANNTATTTAGSKTVTFGGGVTDGAGANAAIAAGSIIRIGSGATAEYGVVASHTSGAATATLADPATSAQSAVAVATASSGFVSATTATPHLLQSADYNDNIYVGASTAGTYTFRVFADTANDGAYQANADDTTPTFTLTVKSPADAFSLSAPTSVIAGTKGSMAKITPSVATSDIRGGSPAALGTALSGALQIDVADNGTALNAQVNNGAGYAAASTSVTVDALAATVPSGSIVLTSGGQYVGTTTASAAATTTTLAFAGGTKVDVADNDVLHVGTGITGENVGGATDYTTTDGIYRLISATSNTALALDSGTPHTLTTQARFNGTAVSGTSKTVEVASNNVSSLALAVKSGQSTNVAVTGANAKVRVGTTDVTYTATAKDTNGAVLSGKDVTFTLGTSNNVTVATDLKANGAAVPSNGQVTVQTDSDGVATLKVTSTKTANADAYTVTAGSGTASDGPITTAYATTGPDTVTSSNVTAVVGGSATVSGKVVDQWGQPYTASGLTAGLTVTGGGTPASGNYPIGADGKFSATISDTANNTTPRNDTFTWTVTGATNQAGAKTLAWRTSVTPGAVNIATTTIAGSATDTAIPFTSSSTKVDLADSGAFTGNIETVKGVVNDAGSTPSALPFADVTYSGSDGVWFYDSDNKLSKTMTATATSTGKLSYDGSTDGIRVLFTKTGDATITAKSGSATKTVTVPVEAATDSYKVIAQDVTGKPGTTITVQGKINDAFGNPVVNRGVTLTLSSIEAGNFSGTDADGDAGFQVVTDNQGVWSTPFTSTSNQSGTVTLTVTLRNGTSGVGTDDQSTNPTANAAYATAGVTVDHGEYQDTSKITIENTKLTVSSSGQLTYGSKYYARGALVSGGGADAGDTVEIWGKTTTSSYQLLDTVDADDNGEFGTTIKIARSMWFVAKAGGKTSASHLTKVISAVSLSAKSKSADHVTLTANGGPNAKGTLTFYRVYADGSTKKLGSMTSTSGGNGSKTFSVPSGNRKFKVVFQAPGTYSGSDTASAKVK